MVRTKPRGGPRGLQHWKSGQTGKKPKIGVWTKHPKFRTFLNRPLREMSGVLFLSSIGGSSCLVAATYLSPATDEYRKTEQ